MKNESTIIEEPTITVYVRVGSETIKENQTLRKDHSFSVTYRKIKSRRHPCIKVQITESEAAAFEGNIESLDENEAAAEDRERRCRLPDGEGGTIMCPEENLCSQCQKPGCWNFDNLHNASINAMRFPDDDVEQAVDDNIPDPRDPLAEMETNDFELAMEKKLWAINPVYAVIFRELYIGNIHPIGIARKLGIPKSTAYRKVEKVHTLAQEIYREMNS